ncbi:hypothetical protein Deipe_2638 [Deinococcus peraridilitoris DSM 19664]|uniref:Uncharacterized protein n=2 Tax=Deinococcus TaxID=1298 RepID=L0A2K9_DEIPD|nr:hypothetical protein Deipe_2638 [Deinococcus peraridilitoris DSM 19664]
MYVTADLSSCTLRIRIGTVVLHVHAEDAQTFANLLRRPPQAGLVWLDALDHTRGARLRALNEGTELTADQGQGAREWITWTVAVDVAGEITGGLGTLRLARAG